MVSLTYYILKTLSNIIYIVCSTKDYRRLLAFLEDTADLRIAKERLKESRVPLAQVTAELKRDGLL